MTRNGRESLGVAIGRYAEKSELLGTKIVILHGQARWQHATILQYFHCCFPSVRPLAIPAASAPFQHVGNDLRTWWRRTSTFI